jgi:hypothetical protein
VLPANLKVAKGVLFPNCFHRAAVSILAHETDENDWCEYAAFTKPAGLLVPASALDARDISEQDGSLHPKWTGVEAPRPC